MIRFVGNTAKTTYRCDKFSDFVMWEALQPEWELDIETNMANELPQRELKVVQFGNKGTQWVLQWEYLTEKEQAVLKKILENKKKKKYIHNAFFEYTVLAYIGIVIDNLICTMLQEKILYTGLEQEKGFFGLKRLVQDYIGVELNKEEQTGFDVTALTDSQIIYAASDVMYVKKISAYQDVKIAGYNLAKVAELENAAVCGFGDIHVNGMELDIPAWRANYDWAKDLAQKTEVILNSYLSDSLKSKAIKLGFYEDKGKLNINWKSPKQKKEVLALTHPNLDGVTKPIVKKYADGAMDEALWEYLEANYYPMETWLMEDYKEELIELGYYTPPGSITINWNSTVQRLDMFKTVEPHLKNTSKESLALTGHPLIKDYREYINTQKLVTSYGEAFIEKYVNSDGKVRTRFNQILNTGRVSSSGPNMQQIPAKEAVGNRYRNCFVPPKDWKFVSSDYNSQELVVIATISQDPVWMEALRNGEDLHSICADMVFEQKWADGAEDNCNYLLTKQKCRCKKHKQMRTIVKTINFGLAYGMAANKLASTMQIDKKEAERLISKYFTVFPGIKQKLTQLGMFGMSRGYIITPPPFNRRRWFAHGPSADFQVLAHVNGTYNTDLGTIDRASKNTPIQGGSGDITKLALVYIRNYIYDNNISDKVKVVMQVHDQIDTICHKDYAEVWQKQMTILMEDAAKVVIPSGLLTSETNISDKWEK